MSIAPSNSNRRIIPLKLGFFGEQGTGKTTSAALLAAALSKKFHRGAPVWVTDPELGWQFPRRRIFQPEGIELVQRTVPTFKAMMSDLRAAEESGACCYVVELAKPWLELLKTVQGRCGDRWGQELVKLWGEWVTAFLNSPLHTMALARVSDITEDVLNEQGDLRRIKTGEGMKAGGQRNNFGYEPHLVMRMTLERRPRRKKGKVFEEEGRMVHRAEVLKDRTWELNGKTFRWLDKNRYAIGGYAEVWKSIEPHFEETQAGEEQVTLDPDASSADLVGEDGQSAHYRDQTIRAGLLDEFEVNLELCFGGQTAQAKMFRNLTREAITGFISETRMKDELPTIRLRDACKAMEYLRQRVSADEVPVDRKALLTLVDLAKTDAQEGMKGPSLTEILLKNSIVRKPMNGQPQPIVRALDGTEGD